MRKSLWIIPVLFAAIVVPYANADSITDPSVITKFKCCDGAKVPIHDLEITFNAPITSFLHNLGLDCTTKGKGTGTVTVTCTNAIPVGDIVVTSETSTGKFALASWTDANGARVATATPTPESHHERTRAAWVRDVDAHAQCPEESTGRLNDSLTIASRTH